MPMPNTRMSFSRLDSKTKPQIYKSPYAMSKQPNTSSQSASSKAYGEKYLQSMLKSNSSHYSAFNPITGTRPSSSNYLPYIPKLRAGSFDPLRTTSARKDEVKSPIKKRLDIPDTVRPYAIKYSQLHPTLASRKNISIPKSVTKKYEPESSTLNSTKMLDSLYGQSTPLLIQETDKKTPPLSSKKSVSNRKFSSPIQADVSLFKKHITSRSPSKSVSRQKESLPTLKLYSKPRDPIALLKTSAKSSILKNASSKINETSLQVYGEKEVESLIDTFCNTKITEPEENEEEKKSSNLRRSSFMISDGVGLANLGNTCFMNSVLQSLAHTKPLLDYCLKEQYTLELNKSSTSSSHVRGTLMLTFANLLHNMWRKSNDGMTISPQAIKSEVQRFAPRFSGYSQHDSQEFLRYILQGLHDDINKVKHRPRTSTSDSDTLLTELQKANESWKKYLRIEDSRIVEIFVGQLKSSLRCTHCGNDSVTFDPFWDLSLPIPKNSGRISLDECLALFTQEEFLDGDERPKCSKCKTKRRCGKSFSIHKFPQILVLHLKRFSVGDRYRSKVSTRVDFPITNLDLSQYCSSHSRDRRTTYNLYAVSNHSGSLSSGHYTAYCRHPHTGSWQLFNDSRISRIRPTDTVTPEAYILFYEMANQASRL